MRTLQVQGTGYKVQQAAPRHFERVSTTGSHIHMHAHAYTCIRTPRHFERVSTHAYTNTCIHTHTLAYTHTCIHTHTHTCIHRHVHTYIRTCACIYAYIHTHMHTHTHAYTHVHTCIHTYACSLIHTYIHMHAYTHICMFGTGLCSRALRCCPCSQRQRSASTDHRVNSRIHTHMHIYTCIHAWTCHVQHVHLHVHIHLHVHVHVLTCIRAYRSGRSRVSLGCLLTHGYGHPSWLPSLPLLTCQVQWHMRICTHACMRGYMVSCPCY